ncbi:hypothetical protein SKAU_G00274850 [Synaphobranchus kaupii]|uniref:Uncharacterized protein n=1 Tax=Synaphobranchus kaupii TaxID=118154 RepID=A0A9Q1F1B2_SYNKA|nr:hypothetical protein SKAU_G00274850 [Synaphobranchus kaupii]
MIRKMVGEDQSLSAKSNVDLGRLPPPQCCLSTHLDRCNHRVAGYKRAATPIFERPKPYDPDQGWEKNEVGVLEPMWTAGPIMPPSLVDLLVKEADNIEDENNESEEEQDETIEDDLNDDEDY